MDQSTTRVVGIDLGDRTSVACVYVPGVVVKWFELPMTPEGVRPAFEGQGFAKVAMEAGAQSGSDPDAPGPRPRAPGREPAEAQGRKPNERKSDRNDALLLAKLATADASLLYPIHHRTQDRELVLSVLRARDILVRSRSRLVSAVRSIETTFPEARRVKQVRGVGPVTALAFVLTLEDPSYFSDG